MSQESDFKSSLSREKIEEAYRRALTAQYQRNQGMADTGYKLARNRDRMLLVALEAMAETTGKMQEEQIGRLMRDGSSFAVSRGTTEHQLCREAYRLADEGNAIRQFEWIYGAAAWLCGYYK